MGNSGSHGRAVRRRFAGLSADAFVSPLDRAALQRLQQMPVLPTLLQKVNELALDRYFYLQNSAGAIRCGPRQLPSLHRLLREACEILDVPEPELYVQRNESLNAYTAGVSRTFVVLHSSLVSDLTDEEILFVLGHELGHIKCGHVLYQMVGRMLIPMLEALGQVSFGVGRAAGIPLIAAFYEWMRQAEFSCDRAGLLTCQDTRTAMTAIMKLGGGGTRFDHELKVDAFLEQARQHAEAPQLEGMAKGVLFLLYNWQLTHPQVVFRARSLDDWIRSGAYERMLSGSQGRLPG